MEEQTLTQHTGPVPGDRDALVTDYLRNSRELISAQRDVLLAYLGGPVTSAPASLASSTRPVTVPGVAVRALASAPVAPVSVVAAPAVDVASTVIEVIARRTGYPVEMIGADLDLEADLSIDSIKRTEIAGELIAELGLVGQADRVEELTKARSAAALTALLQAGGTESATISAEPATVVTEPVGRDAVTGESPTRYVLELVDTDPRRAEQTVLVGANIVIAGGDPALAEELAGQLSARGVMPFVVEGMPELDDSIAQLDGLISLHAMETGDEPVLPGAYAMFRSALVKNPRWFVAAAPSGEIAGRRTLGLRGFFRSVAREYPEMIARLAEVGMASVEDLAQSLLGELLTSTGEPVVVLDGERRQAFELAEKELGSLAATGGGPAGVGPAEAAALGVDSGSVALMIGGARGITAQAALALATASGCRIELAGRTAPSTAPEHHTVQAVSDLAGVRGALARLEPAGSPAEIDRAAKEVLAQREVAQTMRELGAVSAGVEYHTMDARDPDSVRRLVKQVHAEHGRIDVVVFAAGVIDDRLIADKDAASFAEVYGTKVDGAGALLAALRELPDRPKAVVFFGSIAAALGNRGQSDYAAANDALEALGARWVAEGEGHAVTVHWGPWAPACTHGGMVSTELSRNYAARGISLIDPEEGVACLLRELAWAPAGVDSVIYTAPGW